jgi:hypothetical protein
MAPKPKPDVPKPRVVDYLAKRRIEREQTDLDVLASSSPKRIDLGSESLSTH